MSNKFSVGNRDANESIILEAAQACGYLPFDDLVKGKAIGIAFRGFYQQGTELDGCDIRFSDSFGTFFVEVKNADQSPSKRKLTERESSLQIVCAELGIPFHVVETPEQMVEILNGRVR